MKSLHNLRKIMRNCPQTETQNVLQHGISVANHFKQLKKIITQQSTDITLWKLPEWIYDPYLWDNCVDQSTMIQYMIYHDCGKPFCRIVDHDGKHHFPNHAQISKQTWLQFSNNALIAELIEKDMDMHIMTNEKMCTFIHDKLAPSLIISALCELHSNCHMFGGIESTSFKIKWKRLNKFGKMYLMLINKS